ncbi:hypothetical protein E1A91_D09G136000v1 [Gossypium mustelinum]|uniref:Glucosamine-phosphate N-acetyltransferase n=1 Tax=Gossypium mustelinum TaxID=34275 RepID=A0A5D2TJ29_GOSMU|nr:hypothetical protein E1A91_D09G136000v1 [Gossypium mustelinum]
MTPSSPFSSSPSPSPWVANQSFNKSWAQQIEESYQLQSALALRVSSLAASAADSNFLDFNSDANTNRVSFSSSSSSSSSSSPQHVSHRFWVVPTLQGMGIGTIIVKRIVRMLTSRDIYDIVALCSKNESMLPLFLALKHVAKSF